MAKVASGERAKDVVLGRAAMPNREDVDAWIATEDAVAALCEALGAHRLLGSDRVCGPEQRVSSA